MSSQATSTRILEAALRLISRRGGADVSMAEIAQAARVSRQAVYLHFADRADLFVALVRYTDEKRGLAAEIEKIRNAPSGIEAIRLMVSLQARTNSEIWAVARVLDGARRSDAAVERSWQDRLQHRLEGCRQMVDHLQKDGALRPGLDPSAAADLLWTITSLRTWEDLVLERGWQADEYEERVFGLLRESLCGPV